MMRLSALFLLALGARGEQTPIGWRLLGYTEGLLVTAGAIGLTLWLERSGTERYSFIVFSPAIVLSGWPFGFGPSVVTALVCGLVATLFPGLNVVTAEGLEGLSFYMLTSLGICLIVGQQRLTRLPLERGVRDLNDAKEQTERAKEAAERANDANEQFLQLISHELRNPLQSITMSTYVLRQELRNPTVATERLRVIDLAVQRLSHMIDDLVDSTRIVTDNSGSTAIRSISRRQSARQSK
jgi:signal transduction histidine kinase